MTNIITYRMNFKQLPGVNNLVYRHHIWQFHIKTNNNTFIKLIGDDENNTDSSYVLTVKRNCNIGIHLDTYSSCVKYYVDGVQVLEKFISTVNVDSIMRYQPIIYYSFEMYVNISKLIVKCYSNDDKLLKLYTNLIKNFVDIPPKTKKIIANKYYWLKKD